MGRDFASPHSGRLLLLGLLALVAGIALAASHVRVASAAPGTCQIQSDNYTVVEGQQLNVVVTRTGGNEDATVRYTLLGHEGRIQPTQGTAIFLGSATNATIPLATIDNDDEDGPEPVTLRIDELVGDVTPCNITGDEDTADITVNDDDGPQKAVITGMTPTSDNVAGGAVVIITGVNFGGSCPGGVEFGGASAICTVNSDNQITATAPAAGGAGTVDVIVTNDELAGPSEVSAASKFIYTSGPAIYSITPANAPAGQSTAGIVIAGSGFTGTTCGNVEFGGVDAAACTVNSNNQITATAPSQPVGTVDVRITNGSISPNTPSDDFAYTGNSPVVTSVTPNSGPTAGGTNVTITGQFLSGATAVKFGAMNAASFTPVNSTTVTAVSPAVAGIGTVDVTVTTPSGTSSSSGTGNDFTYTAAPTITGLAPDTGPTGGNNAVVITGTNLLGVTDVSFNATDALDFVINGSTQITATAPPHALGTVDVRVTNASGTSPNTAADDYDYLGGPNITDVTPSGGPTVGGTVVTITGSGFTGVTAVSFGATAATSFTFVSDTSVTATSPAHALGAVHVRVTAPGGTSPEVPADQFTYGVPSVTLLTPATGVKTGGNFITITGSNFIGATKVFFGANESAAFQVTDSTSIVAQVPAGTGVVHVRVQTDAGLSATTVLDEYTYNALPTITSMSPNMGPAAGGTQVVITGSDFTGSTSVAFGGTAATSFQVNNSTTITAVAPPGTPGTVTVRVVTPQGTSPTGAGANYTYQGNTPTFTYNLSFRWNLVTWAGPTGIDIVVALQSMDGNSQTTSLWDYVTAVYYYQNPGWQRFFPTGIGVPGANTLSVLVYGNAYWIALSQPINWVIPGGP